MNTKYKYNNTDNEIKVHNTVLVGIVKKQKICFRVPIILHRMLQAESFRELIVFRVDRSSGVFLGLKCRLKI